MRPVPRPLPPRPRTRARSARLARPPGAARILGLALALLLAAAGSAAAQLPLPTGAQSLAPGDFADVPEGHWARDAIERMSALGVLTGYPDGTFGGARTASRYELAVVAARLLDVAGGSLARLAEDARFRAQVTTAAADLERIRDAEERLARLERAADLAASTARVAELEARVATLEAVVAGLTGEPVPGAPDAGVAPGSAGGGAPAAPATALEAARAQEAASGGPLPSPVAADGARAARLGVGFGAPGGLGLHADLPRAFGAVGVRGGVDVHPRGAVRLEADAWSYLPLELGARADAYAGGGLAFGIGADAAPVSGILFVGAEADLSGRTLVWAEAGPRLDLRPAGDGAFRLGEGVAARAGLRFRLGGGAR